jgi:hypothetical protein
VNRYFQATIMDFDISLNLKAIALFNFHTAFIEIATKMWFYARSFSKNQSKAKVVISKNSSHSQRSVSLLTNVTETIQNLIKLAFATLKSQPKKRNTAMYTCAMSKQEVTLYIISIESTL